MLALLSPGNTQAGPYDIKIGVICRLCGILQCNANRHRSMIVCPTRQRVRSISQAILKAETLRALVLPIAAFIALCSAGCSNSVDPHVAHDLPPKYVIDKQVADAVRSDRLPDLARRVFEKIVGEQLHELTRSDLQALALERSWDIRPNGTCSCYSFPLNNAVPDDPIDGKGAHSFSMAISVCHECNIVVGGSIQFSSFGGS